MRSPLLLLLLFAACSSAGLERSLAPAQVVQRFYETRIAARMNGAPSEAELALLAPYLSDTLTSLLRAARRVQEADRERAPDEKPAFAEGDLFSSLFEGPSSVVVEAKDTVGTPRRYVARLTYQAPDGPFTWTDEVLVEAERGRWVISDFEFQGTWDFATHGTLRRGLEDALRE